MKNYNELKNYQVQLLNLKDQVLEDNPELKKDLQEVTNILKQFKEVRQYERQYTKEELREQISSIRNIEYLIEQQQNKLFTMTDSSKVQDSFYKTNITIIGMNIRRLKEYKKELKSKIKNNQIFFTEQKKCLMIGGSNNASIYIKGISFI